MRVAANRYFYEVRTMRLLGKFGEATQHNKRVEDEEGMTVSSI